MNRFFPNYDTYKITSPFGMRTLRGVTKLHKGIDLVAKTESGGSAVDYVTAHSGGTVTGSGYDASAGNYIKIRTAPGVTMVYYHLANRAVERGKAVKRGDILGYMGATGNVTGAHLHFGIQADGQWIDPAPYLDTDFDNTCPDSTNSDKEYTGSTNSDKTLQPSTGSDTQNSTAFHIPTLRRGDKSETVRAMQALLILRCFSCGKHAADGSFGPDTEAALEAFCGETVCDGAVWLRLLGVTA